LETVFERTERSSGFHRAPCTLEQSHQPQPHAGGLEADAHLVGELVVNRKHGAVSFQDASDVPGTLRSLECGYLIHEVIGRESSGARKAMHRATSPFVEGEYARKWKL
jgi:hypothetical protein